MRSQVLSSMQIVKASTEAINNHKPVNSSTVPYMDFLT
jgi:hypothetical protein